MPLALQYKFINKYGGQLQNVFNTRRTKTSKTSGGLQFLVFLDSTVLKMRFWYLPSLGSVRSQSTPKSHLKSIEFRTPGVSVIA